jgi:hypothetical protein
MRSRNEEKEFKMPAKRQAEEEEEEEEYERKKQFQKPAIMHEVQGKSQ